MTKKAIKLVVLITIILIGCVIYLLYSGEHENTKVKIPTDTLLDNQNTNTDEIVFYDLKQPDQGNDSTSIDQVYNQIKPCTTDIDCQVKNKNISNPYDIILINEANDNINPDAISERDRYSAEQFAKALNNSPLSENKNEMYDLLDELAIIQEDIDMHQKKAKSQ